MSSPCKRSLCKMIGDNQMRTNTFQAFASKTFIPNVWLSTELSTFQPNSTDLKNDKQINSNNEKSHTALLNENHTKIKEWLKSLNYQERAEIFVLHDTNLTKLLLSIVLENLCEKNTGDESDYVNLFCNRLDFSPACQQLKKNNWMQTITQLSVTAQKELLNLLEFTTLVELFDTIIIDAEYINNNHNLEYFFQLLVDCSNQQVFSDFFEYKYLLTKKLLLNEENLMPKWFQEHEELPLGALIAALYEQKITIMYIKSVHKELFLRKELNYYYAGFNYHDQYLEKISSFWADENEFPEHLKLNIVQEAYESLEQLEIIINKDLCKENVNPVSHSRIGYYYKKLCDIKKFSFNQNTNFSIEIPSSMYQCLCFKVNKLLQYHTIIYAILGVKIVSLFFQKQSKLNFFSKNQSLKKLRKKFKKKQKNCTTNIMKKTQSAKIENQLNSKDVGYQDRSINNALIVKTQGINANQSSISVSIQNTFCYTISNCGWNSRYKSFYFPEQNIKNLQTKKSQSLSISKLKPTKNKDFFNKLEESLPALGLSRRMLQVSSSTIKQSQNSDKLFKLKQLPDELDQFADVKSQESSQLPKNIALDDYSDSNNYCNNLMKPDGRILMQPKEGKDKVKLVKSRKSKFFDKISQKQSKVIKIRGHSNAEKLKNSQKGTKQFNNSLDDDFRFSNQPDQWDHKSTIIENKTDKRKCKAPNSESQQMLENNMLYDATPSQSQSQRTPILEDHFSTSTSDTCPQFDDNLSPDKDCDHLKNNIFLQDPIFRNNLDLKKNPEIININNKKMNKDHAYANYQFKGTSFLKCSTLDPMSQSDELKESRENYKIETKFETANNPQDQTTNTNIEKFEFCNNTTIACNKNRISSFQQNINYTQLSFQLFYEKMQQDLEQSFQTLKKMTNRLLNIRENVFEAINIIIKNTFTLFAAEAVLYGSCRTGLALPNSDIDILIKGIPCYSKQDCTEVLKTLKENLELFFFIEKVKFIPTATIPVLKVTCNPNIPFTNFCADEKKMKSMQPLQCLLSKINFNSKNLNKDDRVKIDITVDNSNLMTSGEITTAFTGYLLQSQKHLYTLVIIFKQLLQANKMHKPYKGGLSSYPTILMIATYLKNVNNEINYSELCMSLLQFYGQHFNPHSTVIDYNNGFYPIYPGLENLSYLNIFDPNTTCKNVASNSYMINDILSLFEMLYLKLQEYRYLLELQLKECQAYEVNCIHDLELMGEKNIDKLLNWSLSEDILFNPKGIMIKFLQQSVKPKQKKKQKKSYCKEREREREKKKERKKKKKIKAKGR